MEKKTPAGRRMKIVKVSIVDQVCDAVKKDIMNGTWKAGEKIPSESELAEQFGVNRFSVRMALQKLNTLGLIETRVGEGSFVRDFSLGPFLSEISFIYSSDEKYREVRQLRELLEGDSINIAIQSATQEEIDELKQALDLYFEQAKRYHQNIDSEEELERLVDADFNFHYKLVKMSRNSLYKDVYYMVQQLIRQHISKLVYIRTHEAGWAPQEQHDTHLKVFNSIVNADPDAARQANREMLGIVPIAGVEEKVPLDW